jgi:hypothetical protein
MGSNQSWLLVFFTDRTEISTNNLKIGVLANEVICHLEHSEMVICDGVEGTTCYKDNWLLVRGM